jgi:hypothetical protein
VVREFRRAMVRWRASHAGSSSSPLGSNSINGSRGSSRLAAVDDPPPCPRHLARRGRAHVAAGGGPTTRGIAGFGGRVHRSGKHGRTYVPCAWGRLRRSTSRRGLAVNTASASVEIGRRHRGRWWREAYVATDGGDLESMVGDDGI